MKYVVFSKSTCPFCQRAKAILEDKNLSYHIIDFKEGNQEILQEMKVAASWNTVPMIFQIAEGGEIKFVGGCSELESLLGV